MYTRQQQVLESFVRVRAFLDAHPATGPLGYADARATLDDALPRIRAYAGVQVSGRALSSAELRRQAQLITRLRDRHMRPIVTIARAQIEPESDVRLPAALRMPRASWRVTKVLQASDGMLGAARPFEALFIAEGLPVDFLAQFRQTRDALERVVGVRAALIGTHVGARAGLPVQLRRARRAVDRLDAVVRVAFEGDEAVLATWRAAKRMHRRPGGAGTPDVANAEVPALVLAVVPAPGYDIRLVA